MTAPFRDADALSSERPPREPFAWGLRVWFWSSSVYAYEREAWMLYFDDVHGDRKSAGILWSDIDALVTQWARTPAGEPLAVMLDGQVTLVRPACVPTMVRLGRIAADAYSRLQQSKESVKNS